MRSLGSGNHQTIETRYTITVTTTYASGQVLRSQCNTQIPSYSRSRPRHFHAMVSYALAFPGHIACFRGIY